MGDGRYSFAIRFQPREPWIDPKFDFRGFGGVGAGVHEVAEAEELVAGMDRGDGESREEEGEAVVQSAVRRTRRRTGPGRERRRHRTGRRRHTSRSGMRVPFLPSEEGLESWQRTSVRDGRRNRGGR